LGDSTDTNTTYSIKAETVSGGADLDLDAGGSGSGTDTISFLGGGATTVSRTNASTITISTTQIAAGLGLTDSSGTFNMEYPIAVKTTSPAEEYQVANAIWFDLEVL
jgi:hypothetical protein